MGKNEIIRLKRMFKCDGVRTKIIVRWENKNALKVGFENMNIKVRQGKSDKGRIGNFKDENKGIRQTVDNGLERHR